MAAHDSNQSAGLSHSMQQSHSAPVYGITDKTNDIIDTLLLVSIKY